MQGSVVMQHSAKRMPDTPDRLLQLDQLLNKLLHQVLPIVIHRKARVMTVLIEVGNGVLGRQVFEQLVIGSRWKTVGVSEKNALHHELWALMETTVIVWRPFP